MEKADFTYTCLERRCRENEIELNILMCAVQVPSKFYFFSFFLSFLLFHFSCWVFCFAFLWLLFLPGGAYIYSFVCWMLTRFCYNRRHFYFNVFGSRLIRRFSQNRHILYVHSPLCWNFNNYIANTFFKLFWN